MHLLNMLFRLLMVNTGSSNTWVGAGKAFVRTGTSVETDDRVVCIPPKCAGQLYSNVLDPVRNVWFR